MDYIELNKDTWDKRTVVHLASKMYNLQGFLNGESSLREIELNELENVEGKSLLHLQCHFGLDTLSWARKGALVTGVDFSPIAIAQANQIKQKTNLDAKFVCSDVYDFRKTNQAKFDIVFTSYGALCWLPDLRKWAETVAASLIPGGRFYMAEFHPIHELFSGYAYFHSEQPDIEVEGTYTENGDGVRSKMATWAHPLSEVVNALLGVGIGINQLKEYPFSPHNCFDGLEEREAGRYYVADATHDIPLVYSILATKPV